MCRCGWRSGVDSVAFSCKQLPVRTHDLFKRITPGIRLNSMPSKTQKQKGGNASKAKAGEEKREDPLQALVSIDLA